MKRIIIGVTLFFLSLVIVYLTAILKIPGIALFTQTSFRHGFPFRFISIPDPCGQGRICIDDPSFSIIPVNWPWLFIDIIFWYAIIGAIYLVIKRKMKL